MSAPVIRIEGLSKSFVLHNQGGVELPVFRDIDLEVFAGECLALHGPSGTGKSSLIRLIYGNYLCPQGRILIHHDGRVADVARALPHEILDLRRRTMGYVSQFLRVIPRVPALQVVAEPLRAQGVDAAAAERAAGEMLTRFNIPNAFGIWRRRRFPAVSNSASTWPAVSSSITRSCCSTSRRPLSTRPTATW